MADDGAAGVVEPSIFVKLGDALETELLRRLRSGKATAADLNVVRVYLKDNGFVSNNLRSPKRTKLDALDEEFERQTTYPFPGGE